MSTREFTIVRRRPHMVDLITPKRDGVQGYRFRAAPTFDGTFQTMFTADIGAGYLDPAVDRRLLASLPNPNHVRCVFDPDTFNGVASINDDEQFWVKFQPVDFAGTPGTESAAVLVVPDWAGPHSRIVINGEAPVGATIANSLQLDLPRQMQDLVINNDEASGGNSLFVAVHPAGGEHEVKPEMSLKWGEGTVDTLYVRGASGAITMSASFVPALPL